jgi:type VI secretion system protein ImpF
VPAPNSGGPRELRFSVLDRLIQPERRGAAGRRGLSITELKERVRRDVEDLLNTRWRCTSWPERLEELEVSLVNYGLPDFTGANLNTPENRQEFRNILERAIEDYEPRLTRVKVELTENVEPLDRTLRFRIDAVLDARPDPVPIVFDSAFQPLTSECKVSGEGR